jgi:glucose/arabinose dehydrogenase
MFLALAATTAIAQAPADAKQAVPIDYECHFTEGPIQIDGQADEAAWKLAVPVGEFAMPWVREGDSKAKTATRARLLWDREYLYFFAEMDDTDLFANVTEHDGVTWNNDVFELFFKPADDKPGYYEFQVNAANTTFDMFLPRRGAGGTDRFKADGTFDFQTAVSLDGTLNNWTDKDAKWSCEGRLAWKDFARTGGRPKEGERWKFALCRYDYSVDFEGPALSTSAPMKTNPFPNFHYFEDYSSIRFVGPSESPRPQAAKPFGIEKLAKLTTSRVEGSPEPPYPYTVEKIFEKLPLRFPVTVKKQPGSDLVWIVTQPWPYAPATLSRFKNDPQAADLELLIPPDKDCVIYDICFDPQFAQNGYVYLGSNGSFGGPHRLSRVTRYSVDPQAPYKFDTASGTTIIEWESDGHNGAAVAFGPDGMMYVTSGDGTSDSDKNLRGQDLKHLTSKLLRIDVHHPEAGKTYRAPQDNPFVGQPDVRPETYAYGLRNPWRIDIDPKNGRIWVGNNGQDLWESIYLVERGANYGWSIVEGAHDFYPDRARGPQPISKPIADHPHSEARSLTGGLVYYGQKLAELDGAYLYADYSTGKIWAMKHDGERVTWHQEIADTPMQITAFAEGNDGDVWLLDHGGHGIFRLVPTPADAPRPQFPRRLSDSGLFKNVAEHAMADGVIPYSVNAPLWSDGAYKERFIAIPHKEGEDRRIVYANAGGWSFPNDTVIIKSFALEKTQGDPKSREWIETRFLVRQQNEWVGYSYEWNQEGTDATLVDKAGLDREFAIRDPALGGVRTQTWHYPSRAECMVCHSRAANFVLGLQTAQMNRDHDYGGLVDNQLRTLEHLGLFRVNWGNENYAHCRSQLLDTARNEAGEKAFDPDVEQEIELKLGKQLATQLSTRDQREAPQEASLLYREPQHLPRLADPYDETAPLTLRARSYLHSNCAQCHVGAGGGNSKIDLHVDTPLEKTFLIDQVPSHHTFGISEPKLIAPGSPDRSVLLHRVGMRGAGQMPQLATSVVDSGAVQLLRTWIQSLPQKAPSQ